MFTKAHARRTAVELVLFLVLAIGGGLLLWGGTFANNMVHDQLSAQQIRFPAKGTPALDAKEFPGLQRYAGQLVDSGPKAKAYANEFIAKHLNAVAGGTHRTRPFWFQQSAGGSYSEGTTVGASHDDD